MKRSVQPMSTGPIDVGIMPIATVALPAAQLCQLAAAIKNHLGGARIEVLPDAYVRVVLIGETGEPVDETLLWPV